MRFRERLSPHDKRRKFLPLVAVVGKRGDLVLSERDEEQDYRLRPEEALRFARWILDTFGEPTQ